MPKMSSNLNIMKHPVIFMIQIFLLSLVLILEACGGESQKVLHIGATEKPPVIDGNLNDICWKTVTICGGYITVDGEWMNAQTLTYVTYDDENLYLAFYCHEPMIDKLSVNATEQDSMKVFCDDNIELFFDINHDQTKYTHLALNAKGIRYDGLCDYKGKWLRRNSNWNPKWEVKTSIGADSWVAEISIPFASLTTKPPAKGDIWGVNFARSRTRNNSGLRKSGKSEYGSWAALREFNQPEAFGRLVFNRTGIVSCAAESIDLQKAKFRLWLRLRNSSENSVTIKTEWADGKTITDVGPMSECYVTVLSKNTEGNIDDVPIGVSSNLLGLVVSNAITNETYDSRQAVPMDEMVNMRIDRYYYPLDVPKMDIQLINQTNIGTAFDISVHLGAEVIARKHIPILENQQEYNITFDILNWPTGRFIVSTQLKDKKGKNIIGIHRIIYRQQIHSSDMPAQYTKLDISSDGAFLLDGKVFCPFFATSGNPLSPLAAKCFNVKYENTETVDRSLDRPQLYLSHGTHEDDGTSINILLLPDEKIMYDQLRKLIEKRKDDLSILCWLIEYEAQRPLYRDEKPNCLAIDNIAEYRRINRFIKQIDSNHMTSIHIDSEEQLVAYKDLADVVEIASWNSSYAKRLIPNLAGFVKNVRQLLGSNKPFIFWIGSSIPDAQFRTAEEIRCATYLTLMHGASGIIYHMGHNGIDPSHTRHWSVYPGLANEVEQIYPIIKSKTNRPDFTVKPNSVDAIVRFPYIIAVNTANTKVNATFVIKNCNILELPFENRKIYGTDSAFSDEFTAFEPHVYRIDLKTY